MKSKNTEQNNITLKRGVILDGQRKIQTQLIIAKIYLQEKQKKSILSAGNISVKDISSWTEFTEEDIRKEFEAIETLSAENMAKNIASEYLNVYQPDWQDSPGKSDDLYAYFYCIFLQCGINYTFKNHSDDLSSWLQEALFWIQRYMQIDYDKIPEGTVTTTIFRKSLKYFEKEFWKIAEKIAESGISSEVIALVLEIPYNGYKKCENEYIGDVNNST